MSDLMTGFSTWATGSQDTATTLHNGVDEKRAEHINGTAAAVVAMQSKLGAASSLIGTKADLATRLAVGIAASGRLTSAEAGDLMMSARTSKTGWLLCDGSNVSRSTYADLWAAIGDAFGPGDGSTTFTLPNFCGRSPMGTGTGAGGGTTGIGAISGGTALTEVMRGGWKGTEAHLLTAAESGLRGHTHDFTAAGANGGTARAAHSGDSASATFTTSNSGTLDASSAHNTVHPVLGVNFFIKT